MRRAPRLLCALACLALPLWLGACASPSGAADAGVTAPLLAPVPAPAGLLADFFVTAPDAAWAKARTVLGGPAAFLPESFGALAVTLLKLPITLAGEIDGGVPVLGAVIKTGPEPALAALGIHVKAGDRLVTALTQGPDPRFTTRVDEGSGITLITLKAAAPGGDTLVLGVLGNTLLAARSLAALTAAGPYVARTLPGRTPPKEDAVFEVPQEALAGPIVTGAQREWETTRAQLDALGAPVLPLTSAVDTLLGVLGDAQRARLTLNLEPAGVHVRFTLTPKPDGGIGSKTIAEMTTGPAAPLLDLPSSTLLGLLFRESPAARAAGIPAQTDALAKLLGKDVTQADKDALGAALRAEDEARGDWVALGIGLDPTGPSAVVRAPLTDQDRMSRALLKLLDLGKLASVKARLKEEGLGLSAGKTVVENLPGDVQRVRFEKLDATGDKSDKSDKGKDAKVKTADTSGIPGSIDLLYLVGKDELFGAVGYDAKEALRRVVTAKGQADLHGNAAIQSAVEAIGGDASFALVLDPIRVVAARAGKPAPAEPAPVVLAIGRAADRASLWARVDVATPAIQEIVKHRNAF